MIPTLPLLAGGKSATPAAITDPFYTNVSLLLHGDGSNGSTTFTDSGPDARTPTVNGNAQISTAQSRFGGASMLFDGNGDYLTYADDADFEFGAGDFTIEAAVRMTAFAANNGGFFAACVLGKEASSSRGFELTISGTGSSYTSFGFAGFINNSTAVSASASHSFSLNTWYDIAVVRAGNLMYLFVDGVLKNPGGSAFSGTLQDTTATCKVGALELDATFKYYFPGYIDELRVTKGVARYTSDYTVAPSAHPNS